MKYCQKCGNEMLDEAVVCVKCGCSAPASEPIGNTNDLVNQLSSRIKINGIIWLVIGVL